MKQREEGVSEVLDEILIIAMGFVLTAVIVVMVFGVFPSIHKTAYIVPQYGIKNVSGQAVITVFDRGGDPVYFNATPLANYKAIIYMDTSAGTFAAVPEPGLNALTPGDLVYLYYTGSGFILTSNLTGIPITTLPVGQVSVRMVDATYGTLISQEIVVNGGLITPTATATVTATLTANVTTVTTTVAPTPNATATVTATVPPTSNVTATATATATKTATPTATAPISTKTVTVKWSSGGSGFGSQSPPTPLTNGQEIKVPRGSSRTFYFVPGSGKAVFTITLDGTRVYTGSSVGSTISYTVTNVVEDRTLIATFG